MDHSAAEQRPRTNSTYSDELPVFGMKGQLTAFSKKGRMTRKWVDVQVELYNAELTVRQVGGPEKKYDVSRDNPVLVDRDTTGATDASGKQFVFTVTGDTVKSKTFAASDEGASPCSAMRSLPSDSSPQLARRYNATVDRSA